MTITMYPLCPGPVQRVVSERLFLASLSKSSNLLLIKRKKSSGCEDKTKMKFISYGKEKQMPPFQFFKLFREEVAREQTELWMYFGIWLLLWYLECHSLLRFIL